jgi:hypothetical protein
MEVEKLNTGVFYLPSRLASRKILIAQNIKRRTGPALCVFSFLGYNSEPSTGAQIMAQVLM